MKPAAEIEVSNFRKALDIAQGKAEPEPPTEYIAASEPVVNAALERFAKVSSSPSRSLQGAKSPQEPVFDDLRMKSMQDKLRRWEEGEVFVSADSPSQASSEVDTGREPTLDARLKALEDQAMAAVEDPRLRALEAQLLRQDTEDVVKAVRRQFGATQEEEEEGTS